MKTLYPLPEKGSLIGRVLQKNSKQLTLWLRGGIVKDSVPVDSQNQDQNQINIGDWVEVRDDGQVTVLAPCLSGKFRTHEDQQTLKLWSQFKNEVRGFFFEKGFLEVDTPSLVTCPGTEPSLDIFTTNLMIGKKQLEKSLPTSPEIHLKKAMALGCFDVFEMRSCFRNGEITATHQPEFTMLEWYRVGGFPEDIAADMIALIEYLKKKLELPVTAPIHTKKSMAQLFHEFGLNLHANMNRDDYFKIAEQLELRATKDMTIDDLFFLIYSEKIEMNFPKDRLMEVTKWPPFQAALARKDHEGWAERFEFYWNGLELANGFFELIDPNEQEQRFVEDNAKKVTAGKPPVVIDEEFLQMMKSGMPPSSGIALGVERLFMAMTGIKDISKIKLFPYKS